MYKTTRPFDMLDFFSSRRFLSFAFCAKCKVDELINYCASNCSSLSNVTYSQFSHSFFRPCDLLFLRSLCSFVQFFFCFFFFLVHSKMIEHMQRQLRNVQIEKVDPGFISSFCSLRWKCAFSRSFRLPVWVHSKPCTRPISSANTENGNENKINFNKRSRFVSISLVRFGHSIFSPSFDRLFQCDLLDCCNPPKRETNGEKWNRRMFQMQLHEEKIGFCRSPSSFDFVFTLAAIDFCFWKKRKWKRWKN